MSLRKKFENDPYFREAVVAMEKKRKEQRERKKNLRSLERPATKEYLFQRRNLTDLPFVPDANSDIAITLYVVLLPYITGILFLFIHIFEMNLDRMEALGHQHSFVLIWLIGYEVLAAIILSWIFKSILFSFFTSKQKVEAYQKSRYR